MGWQAAHSKRFQNLKRIGIGIAFIGLVTTPPATARRSELSVGAAGHHEYLCLHGRDV